MKYDDDWTKESWNCETLKGRGDEDDTIVRTRSFSLANQCEYGPVLEFRDEFRHEPSSVYHLMVAQPHWADPVYYPA